MSQVLAPPVAAPMAAALATIEAGFDMIAGLSLSELGNAQLLDAVATLRRLGSRCDSALLRLIGDAEARGAAAKQGAVSTSAWLSSGLHMHPGEAKRTVGLAAALHAAPADPGLDESRPGLPGAGTPDTRLGEEGSALLAGSSDEGSLLLAGSSGEGSSLLASSSGEGSSLLAGSSGEGSSLLAGSSGEGSSLLAGSSGEGLPARVGPFGVVVGAPLSATRRLLSQGLISAEHAGVIDTALRGLPHDCDPLLIARGEAYLLARASESDPQRLAALGKHLGHTLDPEGGARLAQTEAAQLDARELYVVPRRGGGYNVKGRLDPELGSLLLATLDPYAKPSPATDGTRDERTPARRNADALADVLRLAGSHPDIAEVSGAKPTIVVTLDMATLTKQVAANAATLDWAGPLSAESARRLACDADVLPVVLGSNGAPLDVGRLSRTTNLAIRRALVARDQGCAFPGCGRPAGWADAHHIIHWADGGETKLSNLVLLCGAHHRAVHHDGWTVRITANGLPEFIPPRWIDRTQSPRAKTWRAQLAALPTLNDPAQSPGKTVPQPDGR